MANQGGKMFQDILILTSGFVVFWGLIRAELTMVIHSLIKKPHHRRKRMEGQSFIDWLMYKRFLDVVPKHNFVLYYGNFAMYFLGLIAMITFYNIGYENLTGKILEFYTCVVTIPIIICYYAIRVNEKKQKK